MESFFHWTQGSLLKHLALQAYDAQGNAVVPVSWITYGGSDVIAEINPINGDLWWRSDYPLSQTTYSGAFSIDYGDQPVLELNWYSWGYDAATGMHLQNVLGSTLLGDIRFTVPPRYTLGDRVWYDQNQNGIQDPNEPGYNGITVQLFDNATCSGMPIASTVTGPGPAGFGDGYYQFSNLLAGDYCVQFEDIPGGWAISPANQGADDALDSDANANGQIPNISLTANDQTQDMGIYVPAVWATASSVSALAWAWPTLPFLYSRTLIAMVSLMGRRLPPPQPTLRAFTSSLAWKLLWPATRTIPLPISWL
jgi:hypothetical protein